MSRSNPTDNSPNPSSRWFEWNGEKGTVSYYDKEKKENVPVAIPFTFILLDEMSTVKGWHDPSDSGIFANEVRDTKQETLIVKSFKGGVLAEGIYSQIRDRIGNMGGHFVTNCYIAYKDGADLKIGSVQFKGSSLNAWVEFKKSAKTTQVNGRGVKDYYVHAVSISGFTEGQKGRVIFRVPQFKLAPISQETNEIAVGLDKELQDYLRAYLSRSKVEQVAKPPVEPETFHEENHAQSAVAQFEALHGDGFEDSEIQF